MVHAERARVAAQAEAPEPAPAQPLRVAGGLSCGCVVGPNGSPCACSYSDHCVCARGLADAYEEWAETFRRQSRRRQPGGEK